MFASSTTPSPPKGKLRVTIQGETIEQQFGEREVCFRTLDLYTSAVLEACLDPPSGPAPEWRELMNQLSDTSCKVGRGVEGVRGLGFSWLSRFRVDVM